MIRKTTYSIVFGLFLVIFDAHAEIQVKTLNFDVYLNGKLMGWHKFVIKRENGDWEVESNTHLEGRLFLFKQVTYRHSAIEKWSNGCLRSLRSQTKRQKEKTILKGNLTKNGFMLNKNGVDQLLPKCVRTFAYWSPELLDQDFLLDPDTARYISIGHDRVSSAEGLTIVLETPKEKIYLGYDKDNNWRSLKSVVKSIVPIEYKRVDREDKK